MLMIHIHFTGCQYIKRFIFFRAPDCQSTGEKFNSLDFQISD